MTIEHGVASDKGQVRTNNEDSWAVAPDIGLFLVADGMGGHSSGEVASRMAVEVITRSMRQAVEKQAQADRTQVMFGRNNPAVSDSANHLLSSIRLANQVIFEASQNYPQNKGMGTTVVAVLARENSYAVAWVGDSRVYLVRHDRLQQLTNDHSLVQEQVDQGLLTPEQAETSEYKNVLTRALGAQETVEADVVEIDAFPGDLIILCSDGLTRMVPDDRILSTARESSSPEDISTRLVALANQAGGRDNITVLTVSRKNGNIWDRLVKAVGKIR
jgi:protein phosphatase